MASATKSKTKIRAVRTPTGVSLESELLHRLATPLTIIALNLYLLEEKLGQGRGVVSKRGGGSFAAEEVAEMRLALQRSLEASQKLERMMREMRSKTKGN